MARVFLLEDHSWFRKALADLLGRQPDLEVVAEAGSLAEARREGGEWRQVHRHADPLVHGIDLEQVAALARG